MKTSTVGLVLAAFLMVPAGVGFGIAQAAGGQSDDQLWTLQDKELSEQFKDYLGGSSPADSNRTQGMAQARGPVETGAIPTMVSEETWMKDYGND